MHKSARKWWKKNWKSKIWIDFCSQCRRSTTHFLVWQISLTQRATSMMSALTHTPLCTHFGWSEFHTTHILWDQRTCNLIFLILLDFCQHDRGRHGPQRVARNHTCGEIQTGVAGSVVLTDSSFGFLFRIIYLIDRKNLKVSCDKKLIRLSPC